jgi:hypothetical protein
MDANELQSPMEKLLRKKIAAERRGRPRCIKILVQTPELEQASGGRTGREAAEFAKRELARIPDLHYLEDSRATARLGVLGILFTDDFGLQRM